MRRRRIALLALCVMVVLSALGCASSESSGDDTGSTQPDASTPSDQLSAAELPEGFPAEVPVKKGEVVDGRALPTGPTSTYVVSLVVPEGAKQLHEWWKTALEDAGFETVRESFNEAATGGMGSIKAANSDGIVVIVITQQQGTESAASVKVTVPVAE